MKMSYNRFFKSLILGSLLCLQAQSSAETALKVNGTEQAVAMATTSTKTNSAVSDLDKINAEVTANSASSVKSNNQKVSQSVTHSLPSLPVQLEKDNSALDNANLSKKSESANTTSSNGNKTKIKCSSDLPCIPMYNKYVLNLDEDPQKVSTAKNGKKSDHDNDPQLSSKNYHAITQNVLPSLDFLNLQKSASNQNVSFVKKLNEKNTPIVRKPSYQTAGNNSAENYVSSSPLVAKMLDKGLIIGGDVPVIPQTKLPTADELIDESQKLYKIIGVTGNFVRSYSEAEDKKEFIQNLGISKVNGIIDSHLNEYLKAYDGVNAEISTRLSVSMGNWKLQPEGKILIPLYSKPKYLGFMQGGLTTGTNDRKIAHLGLGERFYPQAKSMEDLGHHMLGLNMVVDKDLSRGHVRGSLGVEYMHDNLKLISNIYKNLTSWKDSPDFEKGYVQERPASGWDLFVEYWFKAKLALKAGITHWKGKDVSPFGGADENSLENSPYIYELGLKYNPVPAITLEAKHQHTNHGNNNSYIGINFNIPLGDNFSFENAFNPDATNKASGSNIMTSRSMFIERDYTMPLQYRSKPGKYYITFVGALGNNRYQFKIEDGFHRAAAGIPISVKASHPSVKFSNNGNYVSNIAGLFTVEVIHSAVKNTTVTVAAGNVTVSFDIIIDKVDLLVKASKTTFERFEESLITLYADTDQLDGLEGTKVEFRIADGAPGKLVDADATLNSQGQAQVTYKPDETQTKNYDVTVIATAYGTDFSIKLHVVIYGTGTDDFSVNPTEIDGGQFTTLTYKNLKPHTKLTFTSVGKCSVVAVKPESAQNAKSSPETGVSVEVESDDEGIAVAYAVGATEVGDTGDCVISTKTQDPYFSAPKAKIKNYVYDPAWELPNSVMYLEPFTAQLKNLKNSTFVVFAIENSTASLQFNKTLQNLKKSSENEPGIALMRLAVSPNDLNAVKKVTVHDQKAQADYMVTGDFAVQDVDGIKATFYHDAFNTAVETKASILAIQQFTPMFVMDESEQAKLDVFSGNDEIVASVINGQPNRAISFFNDEDNIDLEAPEQFDASGTALIKIKGLDKRTNEPFTLKALCLGKTIDLKDAVGQHPLSYHIYAPIVAGSSVSGGSNVRADLSGKHFDGLPVFDSHESTLDYGTEYTVTLNGLLPNSKASITSNQEGVKVSLLSEMTDDKGQILFKIAEIKDTAIKNVDLTLKYHQTSSDEAVLAQNYSFNLLDYSSQLRLELDKDAVLNNGQVTAVLSGGKPGEEVKWSTDGSAAIVSTEDKFNEQGVATAVVRGDPVDHNGVADVQSGSVIAESMSLPALKHDFTVNLTQYKAQFNQAPLSTYPQYPLTNGVTNDISKVAVDYKTAYTNGELKIDNVLPSSAIEVVSSTNDLISSVGGKADEHGVASFNIAPVNDLSLKQISFKVKYYSTEVGTKVSEDFVLKMVPYALTLSTSPEKDTLTGYEKVTAVLSGGKPGEEVKWSTDGSAAIVSTEDKFNEQGVATAVVRGDPVDHNGVADVQSGSVIAESMSLPALKHDFTVNLTQYKAQFNQAPLSTYPQYPLTNGVTNDISKVAVDYKTAYTNGELKIDNVLPSSAIEVVSSTNDLISSVGGKADEHGVASFNIAPVNDLSLKQISFKVKYYSTEVGTKVSEDFVLKMVPYALTLSTSPEKDTLTGYEKVTAVLSGGKPGEEVTWHNIGKIVIVSQENDSKFDANGNSQIVIAGAPSENNGNAVQETGSITATAMTKPTLRKDYKVVTNDYTMVVTSAPTFSYPSAVALTSDLSQAELDYNREYSNGTAVQLSGMAASRPIRVAEVKAVTKSGSDMSLPASTVTVASRKTATDGTAKLNIASITDPEIKKVKVKVRYPSTETGFKDSSEIVLPLHTYNLAVNYDKSEIVGDDTAKVTVSGGKPGTAASISLANNISGTAPATFDNSGNAVFTVKGVYPDATKGFTGSGTVTASSSLASTNVSKSINVKLNQFNCNFSQGPAFTYPSTVATTTTESSAKLDYKRTYSNGLILKDMAPGKSISIASAQLVKADGTRQNWNGVTLASDTVASDKTAKLNIAQVSDYNFKKVAVKVNYPSTEIGHLTSKEFILPLYQYNLAIASDKSEIVGDDTAKVTVSGGKPGETVAWSNTGSGKILDGKSTTFDDKGNAYATVQGIAPFTNTVKTSVSTFSANLNNSIQLVNIYTIKGSNVAECHVFDIVEVWKLLYILNISVKSNDIEKAYITATLTAEGDDEFIFKLNNSYNMSLPSNAGSCMTCSACGNYTNFYKNSTKTFDVTQYLQDTNSIYVYFHNFSGGYSYKISNLEFTIKTYSKL